MRASAKQSPKVKPELTAVERDVLSALADGGRITADRTFPRPHRFTLHRLLDNGSVSSKPITATAVAALVEWRYVLARAHGQNKDRIDYLISTDGRRVVDGEVTPLESGQLDAFLDRA